MRNLIFQMMVSLDGYYEGSNGEIDWHTVEKEFNDYAADLLDQVDTLIFGRKTYELMASYWPTELALNDDPLVAKKMNVLSKIVVSRTLKSADWQNTKLIADHVEEEIRNLKNIPGKDLAIFGSSDLSLSLLEYGLIDEIRIFVNPVLLGKGKPLFQGLKTKINLELTQTRTLKSGLVMLYYKPAKKYI
ncbi:dihydrofolate reductase family protein [Leptospira sp. 'Mane']|uniref:dihydrofolate reductase family protein n=1 Tax=Leptospira sp. 'Mane' TaxID=3387407 RepID=UPI00398B602A